MASDTLSDLVLRMEPTPLCDTEVLCNWNILCFTWKDYIGAEVAQIDIKELERDIALI